MVWEIRLSRLLVGGISFIDKSQFHASFINPALCSSAACLVFLSSNKETTLPHSMDRMIPFRYSLPLSWGYNVSSFTHTSPIQVLTLFRRNATDFLTVIGGLITPTILISGAGSNALNLDQETRQYMISASLIVSGLMRFVCAVHVV